MKPCDGEFMVTATASPTVLNRAEIGEEALPLAFLDALEESLRRGNLDSALELVDTMRRRSAPRLSTTVPMHCRLTDREWSTLVLLTDATLSQKDLACRLGISVNTLKTHLRSLYQKLGAHSRAEAIELGLEFA